MLREEQPQGVAAKSTQVKQVITGRNYTLSRIPPLPLRGQTLLPQRPVVPPRPRPQQQHQHAQQHALPPCSDACAAPTPQKGFKQPQAALCAHRYPLAVAQQ
mgnify:CR=1 FL=1